MSNPPPRRFDEKLSRGLVRQEVRAIDRNLGEMVARLRGVMNPTMTKVGRGQKITERDLRSLDAAFRETIADGSRYLDGAAIRDFRSVQARHHFVQVRLLNVLPDEAGTEFSLAAVRFLVEPRRVVAAAVRTPLSFSRHLAERLLQRRRSEITAKPVTGVGQSLAESTGLLAFAIRAASACPERRLAIPYEEGLILGEVEEASSCDMFDVSEFTHGNGEARVPVSLPTAFSPIGQKGHFVRGRILTFSGRTFIGRDEMYPKQEELHAAWTEFARRHADAVRFMARMCLWPGLTDRELRLMWDDHAGKVVGLRILDDACEDAHRIVCDPSFAKAMGNTSPPAEPPESFIEAGFRNRRMKQGIFDDEEGEAWIDTGFRR